MDTPSRYTSHDNEPERNRYWYVPQIGVVALGGLGGAVVGAIEHESIKYEAILGIMYTSFIYAGILASIEGIRRYRNKSADEN